MCICVCCVCVCARAWGGPHVSVCIHTHICLCVFVSESFVSGCVQRGRVWFQSSENETQNLGKADKTYRSQVVNRSGRNDQLTSIAVDPVLMRAICQLTPSCNILHPGSRVFPTDVTDGWSCDNTGSHDTEWHLSSCSLPRITATIGAEGSQRGQHDVRPGDDNLFITMGCPLWCQSPEGSFILFFEPLLKLFNHLVSPNPREDTKTSLRLIEKQIGAYREPTWESTRCQGWEVEGLGSVGGSDGGLLAVNEGWTDTLINPCHLWGG